MSYIQRPFDFFEDLLQTIARAKRRVYVEAMLFESGEHMDKLGTALLSAARRGVEVKLIYDWVSARYTHNELRFFPEIRTDRRLVNTQVHQRTHQLTHELRQAGVGVTIINHPVLWEYGFPVINRNHSKLYIVDDYCGWVGGVNLSDVSLQNTDCMVKTFSSCLIEALSDYFLSVWNRTLIKDYSVSCGDAFHLYIDSGKHGKSLIYKTGLAMVSQAKKHIVFVSQYVPNGPLLQALLLKAKENTPITIITSSRDNNMFTAFPYRFFYTYFRSQIRKYPSIRFFHYTQKIHAKLLIIDNEEIFIGSHNMAYSGVLFGTQEISLWSRDEGLVCELSSFAEKLIL